MRTPKLGEVWWVKTTINVPNFTGKAKIVQNYCGMYYLIEYNDSFKKIKPHFWKKDTVLHSMQRIDTKLYLGVVPIKLAEKYVPNTSLFRKLYPDAKILDSQFLVVEEKL